MAARKKARTGKKAKTNPRPKILPKGFKMLPGTIYTATVGRDILDMMTASESSAERTRTCPESCPIECVVRDVEALKKQVDGLTAVMGRMLTSGPGQVRVSQVSHTVGGHTLPMQWTITYPGWKS